MVQVHSKHIAKLHTLEELRKSGFGRPSPRHGLQLLFWFLNDCLELDFCNNMLVQCHPERGDFGFHHFGNFEEFLPILAHNPRETYYEVGNLNAERYPESLDLPNYVRESYGLSRNFYESNQDRIIVRYKSPNLILKVYITQHQSEGFDIEHTHLLSPSLVQIIKHPDLDLETFLIETGFTTSLTLFPLLRNIISPSEFFSSSIPVNRPEFFSSIPVNRSESEPVPFWGESIQDTEQGLSLPSSHVPDAPCSLKMCILGGIIALILLVVIIVVILYVTGILTGI